MYLSNIIKRVNEAFGFRSDKQMAELLQLSQQNFSNRKKGTLLPEIIELMLRLHPEVNYDWLLTGRGSQPKMDNNDFSYGPLEIELLSAIIKGVEDYLKTTKSALYPETKARLISLLYERFARTGEDVDQETVISYLKLVA